MSSVWLAALLLGFVLPGDGPVNPKQFRATLRQFRACAGSAQPAPGGPTLSGGSQYAELMRLELRGLEKKRWRRGAGERTFQLDKKAAFGQQFRFQLEVGTEQVNLVRIMAGGRGDRSAYGATWQGTRFFVYPMVEQCTPEGCAWARSTAIEMTCGKAVIPAG